MRTVRSTEDTTFLVEKGNGLRHHRQPARSAEADRQQPDLPRRRLGDRRTTRRSLPGEYVIPARLEHGRHPQDHHRGQAGRVLRQRPAGRERLAGRAAASTRAAEADRRSGAGSRRGLDPAGAARLLPARHARERPQGDAGRRWRPRSTRPGPPAIPTSAAPDQPIKTKDELVTLASIVEKETGLETERPMVAAVFINRLQAGHAAPDRPDHHLRPDRAASARSTAASPHRRRRRRRRTTPT